MPINASTQPQLMSSLAQVRVDGQGRVDLGRLTASEADRLLVEIAKHSLRGRDGQVKGGYLRVRTDAQGQITEVGRSALGKAGQMQMASLVRALAKKAWGGDSLDFQSLKDYLGDAHRDDQRLGTRSMVKLVAHRVQAVSDNLNIRRELLGRYEDSDVEAFAAYLKSSHPQPARLALAGLQERLRSDYQIATQAPASAGAGAGEGEGEGEGVDKGTASRSTSRGAAGGSSDKSSAPEEPAVHKRSAGTFDAHAPSSSRTLVRLGLGLQGDARAGTGALVVGQVGYNYDVPLVVGQLAAGAHVNAAVGPLGPAMVRDVLRGVAVGLVVAGRAEVKASGEQATDVAHEQREVFGQNIQAFREARDPALKNRLAVRSVLSAIRLGQKVENMGHRPTYEYSMAESATLLNRQAIREADPKPRPGELDRKDGETGDQYQERLQAWQSLHRKAVRFVARQSLPQTPAGEQPIVQTDTERRRGQLAQRAALLTSRGLDDFGRIIQNTDQGIDHLHQGHHKRALATAALSTARNLIVDANARLMDPTGGLVATPILDAGLRLMGAGVSAVGQAIGHATGLEAAARRQDDIELHNEHYFGRSTPDTSSAEDHDTESASGSEPLPPGPQVAPTHRAQQVMDGGLRFRGSVEAIGSERAGLPQLDRGGPVVNFLGQRLGRANWTNWTRENFVLVRTIGGVVVPAVKGIGTGFVALGDAARRGGVAVKRTFREWFAPTLHQAALDRKRDALVQARLIQPEAAIDASSRPAVDIRPESGLVAPGSASPADKADQDQQLRDQLTTVNTVAGWRRVGRDWVQGEVLGFGKQDKADHNIRAWFRHLKAQQADGLSQDEVRQARTFDHEAAERARQAELQRIRERLAAQPVMKNRKGQEVVVGPAAPLASGDPSGSGAA